MSNGFIKMINRLKYFLISIVLVVTSYCHVFLNKTDHITKEITYIECGNRDFLGFIKAPKIVQYTSHSLLSFLKRTENGNLHLNSLISYPFQGLATTKAGFITYFTRFLVKNYSEIFQKCKVIIVSDEYSLPNKVLVKTAKKNGIHTVALQHGVIYPTHPGYVKYLNENSESVVDTFLCYSNYEKSILQHGSIQNIHVIGSPRFDPIVPKKKDGNHVMWATQSHDMLVKKSGETRKNIHLIKQFLKLNKNVTLTIKLHPNESFIFSPYWSLKILFPKRVTITRKSNLIQILKRTTVVITKSSTVGFEALLSGTPFIILDLTPSLDYSIYKQINYPYIAKSIKDFERVYTNLTNTETTKFEQYRIKLIKERFPFHGRSVKKFHEAITHCRNTGT